ncbi:uncharacterized protein LOC103699943 [Phoenix dactylifera]|uniref:Uncharacterized protein LOC103699943 n=1 Tax=Phoenix dactylifera TaxID=42345 RepID=A0A8B8ZVA2_PHODC|nr:uncharacterized protein LOC103699943 [Phoenix dactylifera]
MVEVKYYIPNKSRMLVTLLNDKDVQNMHQIHVNLNAPVIEMVVSHIPCLTEAADVVIDISLYLCCIAYFTGLVVHPKMLSVVVDLENFQMVAQEFNDVETLRDAIRNFCIANYRDFVFVKNNPQRVTVECANEECEWRIHASRLGNQERFAIKKLNSQHTCGGGLHVRSHPKASKHWVSNIVKDKLQDMPLYRPTDIVKDIHREYGVELPYHQVWHGKEVAMKDLYGHRSKSYDRIRWYCKAIIETNPGSIAEYETIGGRFRCLFILFHASVMGFIRGCRPLIFMDGTFIKHKDGGVVLGATSKDANGGIFPIAYGVVDTETDDNWEWFCRILKEAIHNCSDYHGEQFTFMMDRHQEIIKSVPKYFPSSYHSYCFRNVKDNFKNQVLVHYCASEKKMLLDLLNIAAYTSRLNVFHK